MSKARSAFTVKGLRAVSFDTWPIRRDVYVILYAVIERLTVVFFIALCVLLGVYLILAPWDTLFGPWGENYLLVYLTDKAGAPVIARAVASNWFRGAVTGLGVLNLVIGFWEVAHFSQSVKMLQGVQESEQRTVKSE